MTARIALVVAPSDPSADSASARREALGWLRGQLARRGFEVVIVGGGADPRADLQQSAAKVSPGAAVLVHVSGRLAGEDSIVLGRAGTLPLQELSEIIASRDPGYVSFILDLLHDEAEPDLDRTDAALIAAQSIGGSERGYPVLACVRAIAGASDRTAFTREVLPPLDDGGPPSGEALLEAMHDRAAAHASSWPFALTRGAPDPTIDGLVAGATRSGDWARVVELRLDRAETLTNAGVRIQELSGIARILQFELGDADAAIDVLERAKALDPARAQVLDALRLAYEASGRAPPIDPADVEKAFVAHKRAQQTDAALLDAMVLVELGAADPEHRAVVEHARAVGPVPILKPLDVAAWEALRAPGFAPALGALLAAVCDCAIATRAEQKQNRRPPPLDSTSRLDDESTVSAVRTLHWAARVLGVTCPDLYAAGTEGGWGPVTHVPGKRPAIVLGQSVLSGTSSKQLAFLAGRCLTWHRPEYRSLLYYATREDLLELVTAALAVAGAEGVTSSPSGPRAEELRREIARRLGAPERAAIADAATQMAAPGQASELDPWIRSAELTAARAGLFLCGELATATAAVGSQPSVSGRPSVERVTGELLAFCASPSHAALRAQFVSAGPRSVPPAPPRG